MLIETEEDVDALEVEDPEPRRLHHPDHALASTRPTTSSARLRERFPNITGPRTDDICYATTNRQMAVRQMAGECDLVLVIGSRNSSNSNRLVEVARDHGADSHLIDNESQVQEEWLEGKRVVGITSGASAPEELVQRLVEFFRARGTSDVSEFEVIQEDVRFMLPKEIRTALAAAEPAWRAQPPGGSGVNWKPWSRRPGRLGAHLAVASRRARALDPPPDSTA